MPDVEDVPVACGGVPQMVELVRQGCTAVSSNWCVRCVVLPGAHNTLTDIRFVNLVHGGTDNTATPAPAWRNWGSLSASFAPVLEMGADAVLPDRFQRPMSTEFHVGPAAFPVGNRVPARSGSRCVRDHETADANHGLVRGLLNGSVRRGDVLAQFAIRPSS